MKLKIIIENQQVLPTTPITLQRDWLIDIFCLTTILLVIYSLWLGHYPLFTPDEGRYSEVAREMIAGNDFITPRVDGVAFLDKPILYYWLQAIAIYFFGTKEWALRLFPMLLGVLGCLITYICGRQLFDRRTGLISAILLATTPLYFGGAHYANLDLEVAVLISATLLFFMTGIECKTIEYKTSVRTYYLFTAYFFAALAFLTKGMIAIAFPGMIFFTWMLIQNRFHLLTKIHLIKGALLFTIIVCPWYILAQKANPEFLHYFFVTQQITRFLSADEFNNKTPFWFYLPIIFVGFFPWTIFLVQALKNTLRNLWKSRLTHSTELFLLIWIGIIFIFFSIPKSKTLGYILPLFPALSLLVGRYLSTICDNNQKSNTRFSIVSFIVIGFLLSIILFVLPHSNRIDILPAFVPYLYVIATIILLNVILLLFLIKKDSLLPLFIICVFSSTASLLTLTLGAGHLNDSSAKSLVLHLKKIIKPQDEVIHYFKYYQDVPLYLGQRVTIVTNWNSPLIPHKDNWVRELWVGKQFQQTDDWLINEEPFWTRWNSDKRVFVFVNANYFNQFKSHTKNYFQLGKSNDIILLSNKPNTVENVALQKD